MSTELELPDLGWSYDDFVRAWLEVESRSAWFKARLAGSVEGDLRQFATDVGSSYQTVCNYRSVDRAFPVGKAGASPPFSFGVADALRDQEDKFELVSREEPWTVAEARLLVARRKDEKALARTADPHKDLKVQLDRGKPSPVPDSVISDQETAGTATAETRTGEKPDVVIGAAGRVPATVPVKSKPDPAPCPGCRSLQAELEKAHDRVKHLEEIRPDKIMAAELEAVTADRDRLAAENAELRLSAALEGRGQPDPAGSPQPPRQAADSAYAPLRDVSGDLVPDYEDFGPAPDYADDDPWPGFGDELPARGRRGR